MPNKPFESMIQKEIGHFYSFSHPDYTVGSGFSPDPPFAYATGSRT